MGSPSRSIEAILHAITIENDDGTLTIDLDGAPGTRRPKVIDSSKKFLRKILRDNGDGTFRLETNLNTEKDKIIIWIASLDKFIQFIPDIYSAPKGTIVTATVAITNATGDINIFNSTDFVTVFLSVSGSANIITPQPVNFIDGKTTVQVTDSIAETVTLALQNPSKTVNVADTALVTFI